MINSNIHVTFYDSNGVVSNLCNRCVRVTDEGVKTISQRCTSVEFLRYIIIGEVYNTLIFGNGLMDGALFDLENILLALSCYFPWYIVELEYSSFSFKKEHLNVPYTI